MVMVVLVVVVVGVPGMLLLLLLHPFVRGLCQVSILPFSARFLSLRTLLGISTLLLLLLMLSGTASSCCSSGRTEQDITGITGTATAVAGDVAR